MTSNVAMYSLALITFAVAVWLVLTNQTPAAQVIVAFGVLLMTQFKQKK